MKGNEFLAHLRDLAELPNEHRVLQRKFDELEEKLFQINFILHSAHTPRDKIEKLLEIL